MNSSTQGRLIWLSAAAQLSGALKTNEGDATMKFMQAYRASPTQCPRCEGQKLYKLSDGGHRCPACKYSFQEHAGRWIGRHRLPPKTWLAVLQGFELGLQVQEIASLASLSMPTASRVYRTLQLSLASIDPAWIPIVRAASSGGPVPSHFRVSREGGAVKVSALPETIGGPILELPPVKEDDAAMRRFRIALRGWKRLIPARLALTLKDLEIRANRQGPLFDLLLDALTRYVPAGVADA